MLDVPAAVPGTALTSFCPPVLHSPRFVRQPRACSSRPAGCPRPESRPGLLGPEIPGPVCEGVSAVTATPPEFGALCKYCFLRRADRSPSPQPGLEREVRRHRSWEGPAWPDHGACLREPACASRTSSVAPVGILGDRWEGHAPGSVKRVRWWDGNCLGSGPGRVTLRVTSS